MIHKAELLFEGIFHPLLSYKFKFEQEDNGDGIPNSNNSFQKFKEEHNVDNIKMYSYPVFNLNHDIALIIYREFTYEIRRNSGYITCTFLKEINGGWKRVSCVPVN